ncbi:MAG TPA: NUDIX domain-containing protein [Thermoanaerobaculia bacterium]|nr:NUDIX domain-containing protein [Thermoanaerobaculia bacterium]
MSPKVDLGLNAVIVAVTEEVPRILTIRRPPPGGGDSEDALPFGPLEPEHDRTLDRALRRWVREQTGLELGYVEQLYTFGDRYRDPTEARGEPRSVSVAYLALVREVSVDRDAHWRGWYDFFPWEDWRAGRPAVIESAIAPALETWADQTPNPASRRERRQRADITYGLGGVPWDGERLLERYELLYEAYLVPEAWRDRAETGGAVEERRPAPAEPPEPLPGRAMALDHRRILATALGRLRGKIKYRPVVFELLPSNFTLLQLQRIVEALAGVRLHKQNFRRLVEHGGLVEGTGQQDVQTGGRPAELFMFRREVLRERPAPGVGLPGVRRG